MVKYNSNGMGFLLNSVFHTKASHSGPDSYITKLKVNSVLGAVTYTNLLQLGMISQLGMILLLSIWANVTDSAVAHFGRLTMHCRPIMSKMVRHITGAS
jgi:hypothetical protein